LAKPRTPNEGSVHSGGGVAGASCVALTVLGVMQDGVDVVEKLIDDVDKGFGAGDVLVEDARSALIENGAFRCLENDVVARIALVELELDFLREVVLFVFGLPITVRQVW
jgi:hypothetical protein